MPEETKLLIDKGIAQLVSLPKEPPDSTIAQLYYNQRNKICEDQISVFKENRKQQILDKADEIFEGKKRKYLETLEQKKKAQKLAEAPVSLATETSSVHDSDVDKKCSPDEDSSNLAAVGKGNLESETDGDPAVEDGNNELNSELRELDSDSMNIDKNAIIEAELAKVTGISKEMCLVQLFTECPWKTKCDPVNWNYPASEMENLRYLVYKDLWEKKYFLTSGVKFGGDFLAYEGDPLKYHALFIIVCVSPEQPLFGYDFVTYGRLGHQVKKTVTLASLNDHGKVDYLSFSWENELP